MRIVAFANHKGGVGKTATAVNLSAAVAETDRRVLLIDLDPQAGATRSLGVREDDSARTVFSVLHGDKPLTDVIIPLDVGFDLVPAHLDQAALYRYVRVAPAQRLVAALRDCLDAISSYDFIFLDCPPNLDLMLQNALSAANDVLVPLNMEPASFLVLNELFAVIQEVQRFTNRALRVRGFIPNAVNDRFNLTKGMLALLPQLVRDVPALPSIRNTVRVSEAPGQGMTIFQHAPRHPVCDDYRTLASAVIETCANGKAASVSNASPNRGDEQ